MGTSSLRVVGYDVARKRAVVATAGCLAACLALTTPALADTGGTTGGTAPPAIAPRKPPPPKPAPRKPSPPKPSSAEQSPPKRTPARPHTPIDKPPLPPISVSGDVRSRVVAIAQSQLGQKENPPGSNCTRFGPCEAWCADFATWVWRQAGVPSIGRIAWVPGLVSWAKQRGAWKQGYDNDPRPGDLVIFSGLHVGIVETVRSSGAITIIAGNTSGNNVARRGPASPDNGTAMGPAAISGYISPVRGTRQASAATTSALPQPTAAQMAAQDPQDRDPRLAAQER
ncbi:MAG: CHAP domain-containing protein [Solirubrobacteraceae bacterium]